MSTLNDLFAELGVSKETVKELVALYRSDQMAAMAKFNELNLPQEKVMAIAMQLMMNPAALDDLAEELGITQDEIDQVKSNFPQA